MSIQLHYVKWKSSKYTGLTKIMELIVAKKQFPGSENHYISGILSYCNGTFTNDIIGKNGQGRVIELQISPKS